MKCYICGKKLKESESVYVCDQALYNEKLERLDYVLGKTLFIHTIHLVMVKRTI